MKCLKCLKEDGKSQSLSLPLEHINKYTICDKCDDTGEYASKYYHKHRVHYKELHEEYKDKLTDSYVANCFADKTTFKAKDVPKDVIKAKRQYMRMKKTLKEDNNVKR